MTLHSLSGAWPISKPVQRLAGIRRLERNARRWRLRISRWIYEVTGPRYALRCFDTHVETRSPPISLQRMNYPIDGALTLALYRLDHHQLVLARLVLAAKRRRLPVFRGIEAGDALLEARELDDDEAVESLRAFEGLIAPAAREHLRAVFREDRGHPVRVLLVFHRIVDFGAGYPIGGHGFLLRRAGPGIRAGGRPPHPNPRRWDRRPRRDSPNRRRRSACPRRGRPVRRADRRRCTRNRPAAARAAMRRAAAEPDAAGCGRSSGRSP